MVAPFNGCVCVRFGQKAKEIEEEEEVSCSVKK
jgi:hypothetical protein